MKGPLLPLCLFAALVLSACASTDHGPPAAAKKPEDGGTARGEAVQARDVTKLTRAYVIAQTPKGRKGEEIRVVLTDGSAIEVVKTLIAAGADVKTDKTVLLEIANRENHADVAKILEEAATK